METGVCCLYFEALMNECNTHIIYVVYVRWDIVHFIFAICMCACECDLKSY